MNENKLNILAISYAKNIFNQDSREFARMQSYAERLGKYEIVVFTRRHEGFSEVIESGNLKVYPTNSASKIRMIFDAIKIGRKIISNNENLDWVVTSQDPFESSLVGRAIAKVSTNATHHIQIHGDVCNKRWQQESFLNRLRYFYGINILKRTQKIRVVSERIKKSLTERGVKDERVVVLPIQPNLDNFIQAGKIRLGNLDTNQTDCNFIYVGRFSKEKNILFILEAFREVYKNNSHCTLTLVGRGPEEEAINSYIKSKQLADVVKIISWTDDVAFEMSKADVLLLASSHEGWAMVLVEAMAVGLPVITTNVGCAGELVKDEEQGLVIEVKDRQAYSSAMKTLASDLNKRHEMSNKAFSSASSQMISREDYISQWLGSFV